MSRLLAIPTLLLFVSACGYTPYTGEGDGVWQDTGSDEAWEDTGVDDFTDDEDEEEPDDTAIEDDTGYVGTPTGGGSGSGGSGSGGSGSSGGTGGSSGIGSPSGGSGGTVGDGSTTVGASSWTWYVPPCATASGLAMPVLFTMHGSGGNGADMVDLWKPTADTHCFVVYGLDSESGTSWNFGADVNAFNSMLTHASTHYNIDLDRLFLHGYSAGAHWAHNMALQNSTIIAGYAVYAGSLQTAESAGAWPTTTRQIPVHMAHGMSDTVVPYAHATYAKGEFDAEGWDSELWTTSGGHEYRTDPQEDAWTFLMMNAP